MQKIFSGHAEQEATNGRAARHIKYGSFLLIAFFAAVLPLPTAQTKKNVKDLPEQFRKWLTEEVVYIISPKERDVFLSLDTDRERTIFIEAFWKQRDPTPNTPTNEFKQEHYRRLSYANNWYGKESPEPGWRSEMGRIYIILGEPKSVEKYENEDEVYPTVVWFYEGMEQYGLPNAFSVVFFKPDMTGEFKLYTPTKYGPQSLLPHWKGDVKDMQGAYEQLLEVSPSLAEVSLSLIPGEAGSLQTPSIASDVLVASKIPQAAYEAVKTTYAEKLLMYKDIVDVEYSANYIESDALLQVIQDKSGTFFVHYLVEPKRLSFEEADGKFRAWLEVNGTVSDAKGTMVHQVENKIPLEFTAEQIDQIRNKLFSYQDMFPLVAGTYKFNCLLKNAVTKEFTSMEAKIMIPDAPSLQISPLVLANRINKDPKSRGRNKPFQVEDTQFVPSPRNDFMRSDTLYLFFQIFGLTDELRQTGRLAYVLSNEKEPKLAREKALKDYPSALNFSEEFPLADFPPAYYTLQVTLFDQAQKEILSRRAQFLISLTSVLPRPWVLSLSQPAPGDPSYIQAMGNQFLNKKDLPKAKALLGDAYRKNPTAKKYALDYARALFLSKDYAGTIEIATPFLQGESRQDFLEIVGQSSQALARFPEAISYYKEYLTRFGTNLNILNAVGECYFELGDMKEALVAWERSLALNPKQEELRKRVQQIKERK